MLLSLKNLMKINGQPVWKIKISGAANLMKEGKTTANPNISIFQSHIHFRHEKLMHIYALLTKHIVFVAINGIFYFHKLSFIFTSYNF